MLSGIRRAATVTAAETRRRMLQVEARRRVEDEGDWSYSSEWWGTGSPNDGQTLFRAASDKGNGVVSVVAYPSSIPVRTFLIFPSQLPDVSILWPIFFCATSSRDGPSAELMEEICLIMLIGPNGPVLWNKFMVVRAVDWVRSHLSFQFF